ncbi:MAG TPA: Gfo/Idh/MocA family oxidoreductase [Gemmataceae bacterium]|jgi:predicted dehydrogenase|nr:Gfo/Idh/MocA family oxidoreductase [Gemmataceae bacterium]
MSQETSRRSFLKTATIAVAAAPAVNVLGANEQLRVGVIGCGGRAQALLRSLAKVPNVAIVAVCDVWDHHVDAGRKLAVAGAYSTKRYQDILDRKDIDAVLIGTPDHWHAPLTIAACAAGKDVYVEKPLTHSAGEGTAVIEAQNRHHRIVQVGTQQRSMPQYQKALEIVKAGRLGQVHKAHLTWNRNTERMRRTRENIDPQSVDWKTFLGTAPEQPFDEYRFRNWRWFWDFGGGIFTDLMVHQIDIVHWLLGLDHPTQALSAGTDQFSRGVWQTPDSVQTLLSYPNGLTVYFEGTFSNARNGEMIELMGTDGTLYLDRGRYELYPERGKGKYEEMVLGSGPKGKDFYDKPDGELLHLTNWIECVRSRKKPIAPAEAGVGAASAAHLANAALRGDGKAVWPG